MHFVLCIWNKRKCSTITFTINAIRLVTPIETGTFQDTSAKLFNELPSSIRQCQDFSTFIRLLKGHFAASKQSPIQTSLAELGTSV